MEKIEIDVTEMALGDAFRAENLPASDTYTVLTRADQVLVHCVSPKVIEEETPEEEEGLDAAVVGEEAATAEGEKDEKKEKKDKKGKEE